MLWKMLENKALSPPAVPPPGPDPLLLTLVCSPVSAHPSFSWYPGPLA